MTRKRSWALRGPRPGRPRGEKRVSASHREHGSVRNGTDGFSVRELLAGLRRSELEELLGFWAGNPSEPLPEDDEELRTQAESIMSDPALIEERVAELGGRLGTVLESLVAQPLYRASRDELAEKRPLRSVSSLDLESSLTALMRRGLVMRGKDRRFERYGGEVVAIPRELGDRLVQRRRERRRGIFSVLTLRGFLEQSHTGRAPGRTPQRVRELYKMYAQETAATSRIERLPEGIRSLVQKAILEFGGILPRHLFERTESRLPHWNGRRWRLLLEQSLVGTVQELDLARYGIQLQDETLVVFNEVALAWLRRVAVPGDPDRPHEELSVGIDLVSNISRFLAYLEENGVRFTVRGEIFKTTERRIVQHLIPNPGRELERQEVLSFIFRFCKRRGLIERTGSRTFQVTAEGRAWDGRPLAEKQELLLDFARSERRGTAMELHQVRLREILLRLFRRVEAGTWYDLMYLPFLARNTYLASLDDLDVEERFAQRSKAGRMPAMEDPQRLAWNLIRWARRRLFLLGLIDLGYDAAGRPVALRVNPSGARLFGLEVPTSPARGGLGALVVTPDFEVALFPTGNDAELIHDLDRFADRAAQDSVVRFKLTRDSVVRALRRGMALDDILACLTVHARTPVPQNVTYSIRDWALRAGLMRISADLVLVCEEPEHLRRFLQDPGARRYIGSRLDDRSVQLVGRITPRRCQSLLRELGYLVELGDPLVP